ncbi:MAG: hypothetical protein IKN57_09420 [Parasporobacterium sp.]|nr:hypothetical protein [Parasporobacterium sp.]
MKRIALRFISFIVMIFLPSQTYSVARYVEDFEKVSSGYDDITIAAVHALADFGHYVQPALAAQNKWKLGTDYAVMNGWRTDGYTDSEIEAVRDAVEKYAVIREKNDSRIKSVSYSLRLDSSTTIFVFLKPEEGYKGKVKAYLDGGTKNAAALQSDGRYRVRILDICAQDLGKDHNILVSAEKEFTVNVSALSYIQTILNSDMYKSNRDMIWAMVSLYYYYEAITAYRNK